MDYPDNTSDAGGGPKRPLIHTSHRKRPWFYIPFCSRLLRCSSSDYVMGESGCTLTVLDVADPLQAGYAYISGGKDSAGHPIITFPDNQDGQSGDIAEQDYRNVVTYLTSIPPLHDVDLGFVVVVDRRHGKWPSVKNLLNRLAGYFPGLVQEVLVLRPNGFLQRTFADMGFKFVKDDFKFQVIMYSNLEELHKRVDPDQLTEDLGGNLEYNHQEWIQHRAAIEKFSASTSEIGQRLRDVCKSLQLTEFPNDVAATEQLIHDHQVKRSEVTDDLSMTIKHGEILLNCFRTVRGEDGQELELSSQELPCSKVAHVTAVERLLVQLEETQTRFADFWEHHEHKLQQCLSLRRFEESFRLIQAVLSGHITTLTEQTELGESCEAAQGLLDDLRNFEAQTMDDLERAEAIRQDGERFMEDDHYAVDCIRPKCLELQRICDQYKELLRKRQELLSQSKDLQDRIQRASQWCGKGIDLLSMQHVDLNSPLEGVNAALRDIDAFMQSEIDLGLSEPAAVRTMFDAIITPEMKVALEQVLQRIDDVRTMCEQKRQSLKKIVDRPPRPVQTVHPEPQVKPAMSEDRDPEPKSPKVTSEKPKSDNTEVNHPEWDLRHIPKALDSDSDTGGAHDDETKMNTLLAKQKRKRKMRRHVMRELIETEKFYVSELKNILEGYADQMDNPAMEHLLPIELIGQKHTLFSNLQEICDFHDKVFLTELEACRDTPVMVGQCFVKRKEEFQMYSLYCQDKVASDTLRQQVGEHNVFFKECQLRLGHKLPLGAYLLKPVQRITKYQLLLKEMLKHKDTDSSAGTQELQEAVDTMLSVIKYVNDMMHQVSITGYKGDLSAAGRLLMQGSFSVWRDNKKGGLRDLRFKAMQRHLFLYENLLLLCKRKEEPDRAEKASYLYKSSLDMAHIGLTENTRGDKRKFELWLHGRAEVYTIQAPSVEVKDVWVKEIKAVLLHQFDRIKETAKKQTQNTAGIVTEDLITPVKSMAVANQPHSLDHGGDANGDDYDLDDEDYDRRAVDPAYSPRGIRKSYSTDSYPTTSVIHKSYSTDTTLTARGLPHGLIRNNAHDLLQTSQDEEDLESGDRDGEDETWSSEGEELNLGASAAPLNQHGDIEAKKSDEVVHDFQDLAYSQRYIALAQYQASENSEASLQVDDMVEILQIGHKGWWFIRNMRTMEEGWTPASFLDCAKRCSTLSTQSTVSTGSTDSGGVRRLHHGVTGPLASPSSSSGISTGTSGVNSSSRRISLSSQSSITTTSGASSTSTTSFSLQKAVISETLV